MENEVELRTVTKRFGDAVAVDAVDLSARGGEFLTLLGPSGCGKTTMLRMISGFDAPTSGSVWLAGQDVTLVPPHQRNVNQVFQSYALFPHLNVWDNVAFGLRSRRLRRDEIVRRVQQGIELVALAGFEKRKPSQLSGGQKQRVALARALVCEPRVLLLDEPLAALDAKLRRSMQIELKRLQSRLGITFIFVTHDQEEALGMSDRIAVVNHGKIEQIGPAAEIYHRPATPFVADFIGQTNILEARLEPIEDGGTLATAGDVRIRLASNGSAPIGDAALLSIRPELIQVTTSQPAGSDGFEAEIIERIFRGAAYELLLKTRGGQTLRARHPSASGGEQWLQVGGRVFCRINPSDIVLLADTR